MIFKRKKNVSTRYSNKCEAFLIFWEFHLVTFEIYLVVQNIRILKIFLHNFCTFQNLRNKDKSKHANNSKKYLGLLQDKIGSKRTSVQCCIHIMCSFKDKLPIHLHVFCTLFLTFIQTSEKKKILC